MAMFLDFARKVESIPEPSTIRYNLPISEDEDKLWRRLRRCNKCAVLPEILDAGKGNCRVNGYCLNVENPVSATNSKCCGKFIGEGASSSTMFIGMNPGEARMKGGRTLRGSWPTAGAKLSRMFSLVGMTPDDFYLTNLVKCSTVGDKLCSTIITNCMTWLIEEIRIKQPTGIVLLGDDVIESFSSITGQNHIRGATVIADIPQAGIFHIPIYSTFHPGAHFKDFPMDARKRFMEEVMKKMPIAKESASVSFSKITKPTPEPQRRSEHPPLGKLEGETSETILSGIITFRKHSASDIFARLVSLYGFDKDMILIGMTEARRRGVFAADPSAKWKKMDLIVRRLIDKGYELPKVSSLENAIEY